MPSALLPPACAPGACLLRTSLMATLKPEVEFFGKALN